MNRNPNWKNKKLKLQCPRCGLTIVATLSEDADATFRYLGTLSRLFSDITFDGCGLCRRCLDDLGHEKHER